MKSMFSSSVLTYLPQATGIWWDRFYYKLVKTFLVQITELCMPQVLEKMSILDHKKMTSKADVMCDIMLTSLHPNTSVMLM